jgi:hypothetical protein
MTMKMIDSELERSWTRTAGAWRLAFFADCECRIENQSERTDPWYSRAKRPMNHALIQTLHDKNLKAFEEECLGITVERNLDFVDAVRFVMNSYDEDYLRSYLGDKYYDRAADSVS